MRTYFFGCAHRSVPGHYLFRTDPGPRGDSAAPQWNQTDSLLRKFGKIDGGFAPEGVGQRQGAAKLTVQDGWTFFAWWDRTGDSRMNSNSLIIAEGEHDEEAMREILKSAFPSILERQTAPIVLV